MNPLWFRRTIVPGGLQAAQTGIPQPPVTPPPLPPGPQPPIPPDPRARSQIVPSIRGFKIAENQSPIPQDRIFFNFNFYDDVNKDLNRFYQTPFEGVQIYRYIFGAEKTFDQGNGSVGFRLPIDNIYARPINQLLAGQGGTSTALGDLSLFTKYILKRDPKTGSLLTVGLAMTFPTGPNTFANAQFLSGQNTTLVQPFIGYFLNFGKLFVHGFTSMETPMVSREPTMLYNDVGVGYFLYQNRQPGQLITAIVPTFEVHVNTPLTHREEYNLFDPGGTPDVVNLTAGISTELARNSVFTVGMVTPVTGPRPFDFEVIALLNIRFGRSAIPIIPMIGG
jgi:hypothetical protein